MTPQQTGALVGYARTSTLEQEAGLEAQIRDLRAAGCHEDHIFRERRSSIDQHRPALSEAIRFVRRGDTFVVTKLDRLARSVSNLKTIQEELERKGVGLRVLSMGLDTATPTGKLMVNLLGSIAEFERELMLERQREGIAKAKAAGKYKGRAPTARRKAPEIRRLKSAGMTAEFIAKELGISRASVFRALKQAG